MEEQNKCPLCQKECDSLDRLNADKYGVECRRCGEFEMVVSAYAISKYIDEEKRYLLSGVTRRTYESSNQRFLITQKMITDDDVFDAEIRSIAPRGVADKANLLILYLAKQSEQQPSKVAVMEPLWDYPVAFCRNKEELDFYINHLVELGLVKHIQNTARSYGLKITFKGWEKIEQMAMPNIESKQAFVAMWFSNEVEEAFTRGISPLEKDTGFSMIRVDMQEYNDKICDRIIAEIKKSRFLIVDVTGHRHAVYFEAGYAMGMGLPVIWTCREDHEPSCHQIFDTRQYNHIFWKTADELREKLRDRILATIR